MKPQTKITLTYVLTFERAEICGYVDYEKNMFPKFGDSVTHYLNPVLFLLESGGV